MKWNTGNPPKNGRYLVTLCCRVDILNWANDLYKVDEYDFAFDKGKSGWYNYDSEYGYYDIKYDKPIAWAELPEPYKED